MAQMRAIWHCEIFDTTPAPATGKPFSILTKQEMMGWQLQQMDCMQIC